MEERKHRDDTPSQKQSFLNECKGNLFEYLVGASLAKFYNIEGKFLASFGGPLKQRLAEYEHFIRESEPQLISKLPRMAQQTVEDIVPKLPKQVNNILVLGKDAGGSGDQSLGEADIYLLIDEKNKIPISLKLCKSRSFVNTKSGGVKSFIEKYFNVFSNHKECQQKLNLVIDGSFQKMGHELYELAGLSFKGRFDSDWIEANLPEHPGQLNNEMNKIVVNSYYKVIEELYGSLRAFYNFDKDLFLQCLFPLLGYTEKELIQVTCFHSGEHEWISSHYSQALDLMRESSSMELMEYKGNLSSFEITFPSRVLQIRVKPMNKFTVPGLKVNCSVRLRDH